MTGLFWKSDQICSNNLKFCDQIRNSQAECDRISCRPYLRNPRKRVERGAISESSVWPASKRRWLWCLGFLLWFEFRLSSPRRQKKFWLKTAPDSSSYDPRFASSSKICLDYFFGSSSKSLGLYLLDVDRWEKKPKMFFQRLISPLKRFSIWAFERLAAAKVVQSHLEKVGIIIIIHT